MFEIQESIFSLAEHAHGTPEPDPSFAGLERTDLAHGAWLDYGPNWLDGDARLFDSMVDLVEWSQPDVTMYDRIITTPRLVSRPKVADHPALADMARLLSERYSRRLDRISANWYRNGDDSVAWHGDRIARDLPESVVATVSLLGPREFRYRPTDGGTTRKMILGHGDLVVMGGSFQRTWRHAIPKSQRMVPPRMVVMFRHVYDTQL